jgi:hypothetical protein
MDSFDSATALERRGVDQFTWYVPDGWQQGRGAWGGLVVGALVRAVTTAEPDGARKVRAVSAQLVAPAVVGEHRITLACVRRGSGTSTWTAVLADGQERLVASVTAVLGSARILEDAPDQSSWQVARPPDVPPFEQVPRLPLGPPMGPVFAPRLRLHPVTGVPTMGGPPESTGWVAYDVPPNPSAAALIGLVDAWWPASLAAMPAMRAVATVAFSANLLIDPAELDPAAPLMHHSFVTAAAEGFTSETRRLWTAGGRLVVENLQSIVLIA